MEEARSNCALSVQRYGCSLDCHVHAIWSRPLSPPSEQTRSQTSSPRLVASGMPSPSSPQRDYRPYRFPFRQLQKLVPGNRQSRIKSLRSWLVSPTIRSQRMPTLAVLCVVGWRWLVSSLAQLRFRGRRELA